jgi:hypothetical protein
MRLGAKILATLVLVVLAVLQTHARAYEKPFDPYPWCAVYDRAGGSNCGFLTSVGQP